ncbi:MAG: Spi family protease inhibitor [Muribaculaceae bacterium]|nr:Spi family protease inhibitor [Muribaculaceae bacterium]
MKHYFLIPAVLAMAIVLAGCETIQEPSDQVAKVQTNNTSTRGSEICDRPYSLSEVIRIADNTLSVTPSTSPRKLVEPVLLNDNTLSSQILSDTVAYIVNYGQEDGFVIVANDSRLPDPIAYNTKGHFDSTNPFVKAAFLDRIETYLASLDSGQTQSQQNAKSATSPVRHFIIEPQINLPLGIIHTFNDKIKEAHPDHFVSSGCIAMATLLTHCKDTLVYHNFYYDFSKCANDVRNLFGKSSINQNELNYTKPDNPPTPVNPPKPGYFYFLDGISAYNQLLYNLGEDSNTDYQTFEYASVTSLFQTYGLLNQLDCKLSNLSVSTDIRDIISLLNDEYVVEMWGFLVDSDGKRPDPVDKAELLEAPFTWIVDGCDVLFDSDGNPLDGMLHCVWGWYGSCDGYYSFPVFMEYDPYRFKIICHWGVK